MKSALWAYASIATLTLGFLGGCGSDDENASANKCAGISCGPHGSCNAKTGACECETGFAGSVCGECASGYTPQGGACVASQCTYSTDCDDSIACNGHETCEGGLCRAAEPVLCGDHGTCQEPYGDCACEAGFHGEGCLPNECTTDADCANNLVCDGDERCIANTCEFGAPVSCGSHGTCEEPNGTCACDDGYHLSGTLCLKDACSSNEECDDGLVCNGEETCVGGGCEAGTEVSCGENEECVEPEGTCSCADGYIDDGGTCVEALAIIGSWTDEADFAHEITQTEWTIDASIFHISQFDNAGEFLVAQNDSTNTYNPDLWSRFDWTYDAAVLYYCQISYDAVDEATAAAVTTADRTDLTTGCAGNPWSTLTAVTTNP